MKYWFRLLFSLLFLLFMSPSKAEDGYRLWLRYDLIDDPRILEQYNKSVTGLMIEGESDIIRSAGEELRTGIAGLLGKGINMVDEVRKDGTIIAGTPSNSKTIASLRLGNELSALKGDGYIVKSTFLKRKKVIVIAANTDAGVLYGAFAFLRTLQMHANIDGISIATSPGTRIRILDHWDNLNGTVERGYAGNSIWDWKSLPDSVSPRYTDYARANASVGINSTVLTNVNANAMVLTRDYLVKVAAIADVLRRWGIRVFLTAKFSAPIETGKLKTADPLDPEVIAWWKNKIDEIYTLIPDFGGFLVKANSEGQPGPQNYKRSHADGANLFADALAPHKGIVMWRAFVYDNNVPDDRAKQAYNEFVPLDGKFRDNVLIQVKNGPVDFQPREPFHPLFGAMHSTQVMPEFQITQEYLGFAVHLVFLAPLFEECLKSDTWSKGRGSLVARVIDGSLDGHDLTGMAGVSNIGNSRNWTGHPFAQANWYAFGRLAWDPYMSSSAIASEWIRMTFTCDDRMVDRISRIMLGSREAAVNYMTPLGLHHIMYAGLHYGPGPWVDRGRRDWTSVYYHRADSAGIGFDRTATGSNATGQYFPEVRKVFESLELCPENLLLWFHHVPWDYRLKTGRNVWEELCFRYNSGVDSVKQMQEEWQSVEDAVDNERFIKVRDLLGEQLQNARVWRDACLLYFQTFSGKPVPDIYEKPEHDLDYYKKLKYNF